MLEACKIVCSLPRNIFSLWHAERFAQFFVSSIRRFQKLIGLRKITLFSQLWLAIKLPDCLLAKGSRNFWTTLPYCERVCQIFGSPALLKGMFGTLLPLTCVVYSRRTFYLGLLPVQIEYIISENADADNLYFGLWNLDPGLYISV